MIEQDHPQYTSSSKAIASSAMPTDELNPRPNLIIALLCIVGVVLHVARHTFFFSIYIDEATQLSAATSLVDGRGLTIPRTNFGENSPFSGKPMVQFPAGYPLLFAALLSLTDNLVLSRIGAIAIAASAFFLGLYLILDKMPQILSTTGAAGAAAWICLIWSPLRQLNTAEQLALGFFTLALGLTLTSPQKARWLLRTVTASLCVSFALACRYAYWPLIIVLPGAVMFCVNSSTFRRRISEAAILLLLPAVVIVAIALVNYNLGRRSTLFRDAPLPRGVYLINIVRTDPFVASSVGFSQALDWLGEKCPNYMTRDLRRAMGWALSLVLICAAVGLRVRSLRASHITNQAGSLSGDQGDTYKIWVTACSLTCFLTLAMLLYLSVGSPLSYPEFEPLYGWTPVQERRYFAPIFLFCALTILPAIARGIRNGRSFTTLTLVTVLAMPVMANSLKDWVGCALGYKGWGNLANLAIAERRYGTARDYARSSVLCLYVFDKPADRAGYEFIGGAYPVSIDQFSKLVDDLRPGTIILSRPNSVDAVLAILQRNKNPTVEQPQIRHLENVVILKIQGTLSH